MAAAKPDTLDVSVLISTRNRAALLKQTLDCLAAQQLSGIHWELIVVDNGSSDATQAILAEASERLPLVTLIEPVPGKNRALNRALAVARGELVVFTDDDIIPDPHWLSEMHAATHRWPDVNVFGGRILPRFPAGTPDWLMDPRLRDAPMVFCYYVFDQPEGTIEWPPFGANLAMRRSLFKTTRYREDIGPADGNYIMGSETELLLRLHSRGEQFVYVPSARVEHVILEEQLAMRWLLNRCFRAGRAGAGQTSRVGWRSCLGVPCYVLRKLLTAWAYSHCVRYASDKTRCLAGMAYQRQRGEVFQYLHAYACRKVAEGAKSAG